MNRLQVIRRWAAAGLAMTVATSAARGQGVVAGNFGPGDSYLTGNSNSWATGSSPGAGYSENAVGFTSSLAQAATLDQVRVAFNYFAGSGQGLTLDLLHGSDINSASLVESVVLVFPFVSQQFGTGELSPILTWTSVLHPLLQPGEQYWLAARPLVAQDLFGWQVNALGETGYQARFDPAGAWSAATGETPVFDVRATAVVAAVPEPSTVALVAGGLLALAGAARRRRS